jgi:hypothetical protein
MWKQFCLCLCLLTAFTITNPVIAETKQAPRKTRSLQAGARPSQKKQQPKRRHRSKKPRLQASKTPRPTIPSNSQIQVLSTTIHTQTKHEPATTPHQSVSHDHLPTIRLQPKLRQTSKPSRTAATSKPAAKTAKQEYLEHIFVSNNPLNKKNSTVITDFADKSLLANKGSLALLKSNSVLRSDQQEYLIVESVEVLKHPLTQKILGEEQIIIGRGRKVVTDNNKYLLAITQMHAPISIGAQVIPHDEFISNAHASDKQQHNFGYILADIGGLWNAGNNDAVLISLGAEDGLSAGKCLNIYRPQLESELHSIDSEFQDKQSIRKSLLNALKRPLNKQGELIVYKTFAKTSLALITKATGPISRYYMVALTAN